MPHGYRIVSPLYINAGQLRRAYNAGIVLLVHFPWKRKQSRKAVLLAKRIQRLPRALQSSVALYCDPATKTQFSARVATALGSAGSEATREQA